MKEYIEKKLKEQREICADRAILKQVTTVPHGRTVTVDKDSILNAPSPVIDIASKQMQWVKVGDRLPKEMGWYCIKNYFPDGWIWFDGKEFISQDKPLVLHDLVEWLDETAQQAPENEHQKQLLSEIMQEDEKDGLYEQPSKMREIKFRAWNKAQKTMFYNHSVSIELGGEVLFLFPHGEWKEISSGAMRLMQYTGLKDKNGVEIYEGDIVRFYKGYVDDTWTDMEQGNPYTIEWQNQEGYLGFRARNGNKNITLLAGTYNGITKWEWEVIGNIYENQDLLNIEQNLERSVATED